MDCTKRDKNVVLEPWMRGSGLCRQWDDMKRDIELHKWYESERAGHDIGWDRAMTDWMMRHGGAFRRGRANDAKSG